MARILVVDDEPAIRQIVQGVLEENGHHVAVAGDGAQALGAARTLRPDVIVLDLMLPGMNGWQFAESYHAEAGPHAPILAITAAGPGAIRAAQGFDGIASVMAKPLDLEELVGTVEYLAAVPSP